MRLQVYLCHPLFEGDIKQNIAMVDELAFYAQAYGVAPVSTHECFREVNMDNNTEVADAIASGCALLWNSHEMWVFEKKLTDRMKGEIAICKTFRKPVRYVSEKKLRKGLKPY